MSALLGPLDDNVTKSSMAARVLREAIRDGVFPPGTQLKLTMLAEELNMSYTPLREALQMLHAEGLVATRPHSSAVVLGLDVERAREVYRLRMVLEPYAARLACERVTYDEITELMRINDRMKQVVADDRLDLIPSLNKQFHMKLYEFSGSPILLDFTQRLWNGVPYQAISLSDRALDSIAGHDEVLAALRSSDPDAVEKQLREHISSGSEAAMKFLEETGEDESAGSDRS
ncbi:MAG: GntR family transcriptional regulator [Leucobacter sp.]